MIFDSTVNQMTKEEIIKATIDEFKTSNIRALMMKGEKYYKCENDILDRKIYRYENGKPVVDDAKTNNKLSHAYMKTLVDDKVNYLLVKPYSLSCEDESYLQRVQDVLGERFQSKLGKLGTETSNKGISWLHPYIDEQGKFKTMKIPTEQCIPLWLDNDHEELQAMIRFYDVIVYEGKTKKWITKIEYHTPEGIEYFTMDSDKVIIDSEMYLNDQNEGHFLVAGQPASWGKVPFVPFKNNDFELPDIQFIKTLVDNYDLTRSDVANLLEDVKNVIFILKGYGGEDLSEFMRDLSYYRAVKFDADEGSGAGLDTVESTINIEAAREHYETLRKDIFDFGQGVDKNSDKLGNSPSGIALKFIYSGLDLKCNAMEDAFKWSFEQLLYFVDFYLTLTKQGTSDKPVEITFNRDIAINESQAITDCMNSQGIVSQETIIKNHPWSENVDEEMKKLEEEKAASIKRQQEAFGLNIENNTSGGQWTGTGAAATGE